MIPITSDPSVAIGVVAASLDSPTMVSEPMSYELRSYTASPACAISLFDFGTTPVPGEINSDTNFFNQLLQVYIIHILLRRHAEITCTLASVNWIRTASSSRKNTSG